MLTMRGLCSEWGGRLARRVHELTSLHTRTHTLARAEEDLASKSGHRSSHTHRSHRSSHSRAKTNDEIKLLNWLEDDSDKDDLDDVRNLQTRGTNM